MSTYRLEKVFSPRSVAVVGASPRATSPGRAVLRNLRAAAFEGSIALVNPRYGEIEGVTAVKPANKVAPARPMSTATAGSVVRRRRLHPVLDSPHDNGHEHKDSAEPRDIFDCLQQNRRFQPHTDCGTSVSAIGATSGSQVVRMPNARRKIPALASTSDNAANVSRFESTMTTPSALECLQIGDDVDDLIPIKTELRHGRMARNDSLGQGPFQAFDRILQVQRAKCRRDRKRTVAGLVDRMALLAIRAKYRQTALRLRRLLCESALAGQAGRDCHQ
jgi:CoA binding domain